MRGSRILPLPTTPLAGHPGSECPSGKTRSGKTRDLGPLADPLGRAPDCQLDGELAWGMYWVFDCLDCPQRPYVERLQAAAKIVGDVNHPDVRLIRTWRTDRGKRSAFETFQARNVEGVVFKRLDAPYTPGDSLAVSNRYKFRHRCECLILEVSPNGRSLQLGLSDQFGVWRPVGRLALASLGQARQVAAAMDQCGGEVVVEVEYEYVTHKGKLSRQKFIRVRLDKCPDDCTMDQLDDRREWLGDGMADKPLDPAALIGDKSAPQAQTQRQPAAARQQTDWGAWAWFIGGFLALFLAEGLKAFNRWPRPRTYWKRQRSMSLDMQIEGE